MRDSAAAAIKNLGPASVVLGSAVAATGAMAQTVAANDKTVETVNVTAQRTSLDKLTEKVLNTPQSIDVVPLSVIQEQGTASLRDALKNVPGITLNAGEGGAHGDTVNLRGFSASDDFFLDGLRDTGFYDRDSFNDQAVEVYKGPASTLFGRGSTGGVVNQVSKMPELYPVTDANLTAGSNAELRGTADFNRMLSDTSAVRVNAMDESAHVAGRDFVRNRLWGVAPSVAFGIGEPTSFTLSYYHEHEDNVPDFGIPFLYGKPAPVARDSYYGLPSDDRWKADVDIVTGTFTHDFGGDLSITDKARFGNYRFESPMTAPHYGDANCYAGSAPFAGAPVCTGAAHEVPVTPTDPLFPIAGMPLDQIYVQRDRPSANGLTKTLMNETDLTWKFATGPFAHTLVAGVEYDREEADLVRFANQDDDIVATPLLHPDPHEAFPGHQTTVRSRPDTVGNTLGGYLVDTIALAPQWNLVAAVREDRFNAAYREPVSGAHFDHTDWIVTPRAALVFKPSDGQSYYFSYGTSFNPSAENLSLSTRTADLGPEKDRTFELGAKQQWLGGMLSVTGALFDTEMTNARIADPLNPSLQALAGDLHVRGAELGVAGNITENWEVLAGYTYLDGSSEGLFGAGVKGPISNTAHDQANLWSVYDFDGGWKIGGGVNYLGRRAAFKDASGVAHAPGYVTFDAMVSYPVNDNITLQLNGTNLFDKYYFANVYYTSAAENHAVPGPGRTVSLTVAVSY